MLPPLVSLATITLFHLFIVWSHPKNFRTFRPLFNFFYAVCRLFAYRLTQFHLALPFTSFWFRDIDFRFRYSLVIQFVLITIERSENCITVVYRKLKVRFSSGFQLYKSYWVHTNRNLKKNIWPGWDTLLALITQKVTRRFCSNWSQKIWNIV